jgi:hypothetical protein
MKRMIVVATVALSLLLGGASAAFADPSFGAGGSDGNGNNGPHEVPNQCHPPGQTDDLPKCK